MVDLSLVQELSDVLETIDENNLQIIRKFCNLWRTGAKKLILKKLLLQNNRDSEWGIVIIINLRMSKPKLLYY